MHFFTTRFILWDFVSSFIPFNIVNKSIIVNNFSYLKPSEIINDACEKGVTTDGNGDVRNRLGESGKRRICNEIFDLRHRIIYIDVYLNVGS